MTNERPTSPPEPTRQELTEQDEQAQQAREDFDEATQHALEFVLDDPDLLEPIVEAAMRFGAWRTEPFKMDLAEAVNEAAQAYIHARLEGRR